MNNSLKKSLAIGYFDGVHLGHREIIRMSSGFAEKHGLISAAITFDMSFSRPQGKDKYDILPLDDRIRLLKEIGIQDVIVLPFEDISGMSGKSFAADILKDRCFAAAVFTGRDFRFGSGRDCGTYELSEMCKEFGIQAYTVPDVVVEEKRVSSSAIRKALSDGEIHKALKLLGHEYGFSLPVFHDKHLAEKLGFPTINQSFPDNILVPRMGVYASEINLDGRLFRGITNLGVRPTVGGESVVLETHILDFDGDLYGKKVKVCLKSFVREEKKFGSLLDLSKAIKNDIEFVKRMQIL